MQILKTHTYKSTFIYTSLTFARSLCYLHKSVPHAIRYECLNRTTNQIQSSAKTTINSNTQVLDLIF